MLKYLNFAKLCLIISFVAAKTEIQQEEECYNQVQKSQTTLDLLVKRLEHVCNNAKLPEADGVGAEQIKLIRNLIHRLKRMGKKDLKALDEAILYNLEEHIADTLRLDKMEKRINEYKVNTKQNNRTVKQLEDIFLLIKKSDISLDTITILHNNTHETCDKTLATFNKFKDDINVINDTYKNLENVYGNLILRDDNVRREHEALTDDTGELEALMGDIKIPQSYMTNYLCHEENHLQKSIDNNLQGLDEIKDKLQEIIEGSNAKEHAQTKEIGDLANSVSSLNADLLSVYDSLKGYEEEIPEKASIEVISEDELEELEKQISELDDAVTKISLKGDLELMTKFLDEYERKIKVLKFILSEDNVKAVEMEIETFEKNNARIQKLLNDRRVLQNEIDNIREITEQMMLQSVCRRTGSEDTDGY